MPFVSGFLKVRKGDRPDRPVDPDYGVDEGELPEVEPPDPPVGNWPPLTPEHPWRPLPGLPERPGHPLPPGGLPPRPGQPLPPGERPVDPNYGIEEGGEVAPPIVLPPGSIWPPLPPGVHGKYLALVLIAGMPGVKYRYVVIDADARPWPPHGRPVDPNYGIEGPSTPPEGGGEPPPDGAAAARRRGGGGSSHA